MGGRKSILGSEEAVWAVLWKDRTQYGVLLLTFKGKSVKLLIVVKAFLSASELGKMIRRGVWLLGTHVRSILANGDVSQRSSMVLQARNEVFLSLYWGQMPVRLDVVVCYS